MEELVPGAITYVREGAMRDPLLAARHITHGPFKLTAKVAQDLRNAYRWGPKELAPEQQEALDLICTKIARIVCGDPRCKDHWDDIAGYAKLGAEACE